MVIKKFNRSFGFNSPHLDAKFFQASGVGEATIFRNTSSACCEDRKIESRAFINIDELQKKLEKIIREKVNNTNIKALTGYKLFLSAYQTIINV